MTAEVVILKESNSHLIAPQICSARAQKEEILCEGMLLFS